MLRKDPETEFCRREINALNRSFDWMSETLYDKMLFEQASFMYGFFLSVMKV